MNTLLITELLLAPKRTALRVQVMILYNSASLTHF
jgi:hypothetical protein